MDNMTALVSAFARACHYRDNTEYSIVAFGQGSCPKAHEISQHLITMPLHMWLSDDDVKLIIEKVNQYA